MPTFNSIIGSVFFQKSTPITRLQGLRIPACNCNLNPLIRMEIEFLNNYTKITKKIRIYFIF